MSHLLTPMEAYKAMFRFLEMEFERTNSDEIGAMLGSLSLAADESPMDSAYWAEWNEAVAAAKSGKVNAGLELRKVR